MKFMIAQPMNGIEESKILDQREEIKKYLESKGHEIIDTFFMEEVPEDVKNPGIYYLTKTLKGLCYADAIVLTIGWKDDRDCLIEREIAYEYGLKIYYYIHKHHLIAHPDYIAVLNVIRNSKGEF